MAIALIAAATAVQTISAIREGQTASAIQKYNARVAEAQAGAVAGAEKYEIETLKTSAEFEKETLRKQAELEQYKIAREKGLTTGQQQAAYAKAGVRTGEGSPLEVMADTAAQYELDLSANRYNLGVGLEKIRYETEAEVGRIGYGSKVQQAQLRAEAQYRRSMAKAARTASYLKAGSTLLTGAATMASLGKLGGGGGGGTQYNPAKGGSATQV